MSLMELFSKGNTGNTDKKTGVTSTGHATQGGNTGNTGNTGNNSNEMKITVLCYSPSGLAYEIETQNQEHAEFLKRMNPKREVYEKMETLLEETYLSELSE